MDKKMKISINFTDEFLDVYEFLKSQSNISRYICETVKSKMIDDKNSSLTEDKIIEIIDKTLREKFSSLSPAIAPLTPPENPREQINEEDADLIRRLF